MRINFILIPFVIILGLLFSIRDNKKSRLRYIITCCVVLVLVAAFRNPYWLTYRYKIDTLVYKQYFESALDMGWDEIKMELYARYVQNVGDFDIGYIAICKIVGIFTNDFYLYSLIVDLLFFVPFGILLYRHATNIKQIIFAFVFYISLVQTYLLGGARQIFAIGLDMMALLAMMDKKRIRSVVFFLLGLTLHMSSLLFALPLIMLWTGINPKTIKILHVACFLLFPIVLLFPNEIIVFMGNFLGMEKYSNYGNSGVQGGASTFIVLMMILSLFCLIAIKMSDLKKSENIRNIYVMAPLFTIFAPLIHSNGAMDRVALYFYLYIVLLVPYGIECMFNKSNRVFIYYFAIGSLAFLTLLNGGLVYYFYWQRGL